MFFVSKLLAPLTQPLTWVALLLLLGLWWMPRRPVAARRVLLVGIADTVTGLDGSNVSKARLMFSTLGLDERRAVYEEASRNTHENAVLGAAVPGVDKTQHWLLVTSARHMPRALATFRVAGWNVTPYPVDYLTSGETAWTEYSLANGTLHWQAVLREYFGWVAYSVTGRA